VRIVIIVEGNTEKAFKGALQEFLKERLKGKMPALVFEVCKGRIPTREKLERVVRDHLGHNKRPADHVIALTDVYTGSMPPDFKDAADAKAKMREWVGVEERFHPHAAQHDFEAWLLPYWPALLKRAVHNRSAPAGAPESVNHDNPPAHRIKKLFEDGACSSSYIKTRDAARILRDNDLALAVEKCPELKSFVNTILTVCGEPALP